MSDAVVWRRIYGKPTAFLAGIEVGDCYRSAGTAEGDVWRVRIWHPDRPDNRRLRYVTTPDATRDDAEAQEAFVMDVLAGMVQGARRDAGE
jgi:hypothetical protein